MHSLTSILIKASDRSKSKGATQSNKSAYFKDFLALKEREQLSQMGGDHVANSTVGCSLDSGPEKGVIPINPVIELKVSCQCHFWVSITVPESYSLNIREIEMEDIRKFSVIYAFVIFSYVFQNLLCVMKRNMVGLYTDRTRVSLWEPVVIPMLFLMAGQKPSLTFLC